MCNSSYNNNAAATYICTYVHNYIATSCNTMHTYMLAISQSAHDKAPKCIIYVIILT